MTQAHGHPLTYLLDTLVDAGLVERIAAAEADLMAGPGPPS
ncbi:hypothetical protein [Sinomonas notoginsengisoli]|nr:hypothetical protein [Sinomonas notoginsengisoli]